MNVVWQFNATTVKPLKSPLFARLEFVTHILLLKYFLSPSIYPTLALDFYSNENLCHR